MHKAFRLALGGALLVAVVGCVSTPALKYQAGIENSERLLSGRGKVAVGTFDAAKGVENHRLGMRGSSLNGGRDGTFATYLKDALVTELSESGRYGADAPVVVTGTLVDNRLSSAGASQGKATLGADFVVVKSGSSVYSRTIRVENVWESSFMGAIAIPAAIQGYSATVQKLLGELFADPDFRKVTTESAPN